MIWGAMSSKGIAGLYFLTPETPINGKIPRFVKRQVKTAYGIFPKARFLCTDGAPCRKAKVVTSYLKNEKMEVLPLPGNSPYLNPIKNLWKILKDKISEK